MAPSSRCKASMPGCHLSGSLLPPSSIYVCACSIAQFVAAWTVARQAPLSMDFSRQECWNRLPFPTPEDLPNPGIEPKSLASPALAGSFVITVPPGKPLPLKRTLKITSSPPGKSRIIHSSQGQLVSDFNSIYSLISYLLSKVTYL